MGFLELGSFPRNMPCVNLPPVPSQSFAFQTFNSLGQKLRRKTPSLLWEPKRERERHTHTPLLKWDMYLGRVAITMLRTDIRLNDLSLSELDLN